MAEPGAPSILTDELTLQIRELVLKGIEYIKIQEQLGISPNTWDSWVYRDTQGFRQQLVAWKKERLIKKAERNVNDLLDCEDIKVRADITKFTLETLAKDDGYTKRTEMTGKDGKDLIPDEEAKKKSQEAINSFLNEPITGNIE